MDTLPSVSQHAGSASPYILRSSSSSTVQGIPEFWVEGTGDLRALAERTGLRHDRQRSRYLAPTPYHAWLLWCYADQTADQAMKELFPRFNRPARPKRVPFVLAADDRVICLATPETAERPRSAGFSYNADVCWWETNDLRRVITLVDIAEENLKNRLEAIKALPFELLADVSIRDLVDLPEPEKSASSVDTSLKKERAEEKPCLDFDADRGVFTCSHQAAQGAGFRREGGTYVSEDFEHVSRLRLFATDEAELRLQVDAMMRTVPDPRAEDGRPVPRSPASPFPFGPEQLDGIRFACTRRGTLLGDDMGTGKTAQALGVINVERPSCALILAPANLLDNWLAECGKWLAPPNCAAIFGRGKERQVLPPGANVLIVSYDMLPRLAALHYVAVDILICDEAQKIKSEDKKAGRIVYDSLAPQAGKVILMTGTPIWNRPQDLWAFVHAIAPEVFPYKKAFMRLYSVHNLKTVSPQQEQRLDFIAHLLKSGLMIRRLKAEVLNLPPKEHHLQAITLPDAVMSEIRKRDRAVDEFQAKLDDGTCKASVSQRRTMFSEIARLRMEVGEAKLPYVLDDAIRFLRNQGQPANRSDFRPLVLFGRHRKLLRAMKEGLEAAGFRVGLLTGDSTARNRQKIVDDFQNGLLDAAVGSYDAAGVGYTLTRGRDFFSFEIDYTPALLKQGVDRIHRRGQTGLCSIFWYIVDNTIEAKIAQDFIAKDAIATVALGDTIVGMFNAHDLYSHSVFTDPVDPI